MNTKKRIYFSPQCHLYDCVGMHSGVLMSSPSTAGQYDEGDPGGGAGGYEEGGW